MAPLWEERYPGRYAFELRKLEQVASDSITVDFDALANGTLVLRFEWPVADRNIPLEAVYPDSFPRLRPAVLLRTGPDAYPMRHCSPLDGTLCLLGRDSRQWKPSLTLRALLDENLEDALNGTGPEDPQGEPMEFWWNCMGEPNSYCLIDTNWSVGQSIRGTLKLQGRFDLKDGRPVIRAGVTEILDDNGNKLATSEIPLPPDLTDASAKTINIPWVRTEGVVIPTRTAKQIMELANRVEGQPTVVHTTQTKSLRCFAVLYDAELGLDHRGLAFLFPVIFGTKKRMKGNKPHKSPDVSIIRTLRSGPEDLGARVPAVQSLRENKVAVFGLGALGAPLAIELARNGCRLLHLVDHDIVEPGNSIRWPLGTTAWGASKASALATFIAREYTWSKTIPHDHFIGSFDDRERTDGDEKLFAEVLGDVDLVVDATASHGVTAILADHCRDYGIPMVTLFASPNLEGGVVARFGPDGGCPTCLEKAWTSGDITKPRGWGAETELRQPAGCAERTFTGASYDLQELSLQTARLVVQGLNNQNAARESCVFTLTLADNGGSIAPEWNTDMLPKNATCTCNSAR